MINGEIAKRAVLKEFVKMIDEIIVKMPEMMWEKNEEMRPSFFFSNSIFKTYTVLC